MSLEMAPAPTTNIFQVLSACIATIEMAAMHHIIQTLASTLQLDELLNRMMAQVKRLFKAEAGYLLLIDPTTGDLVCQICLDYGQQPRNVKPFRLASDKGFVGQVVRTGQVYLLNHIAPKDRARQPVGASSGYPRNVLAAPLHLYGQVIGVLVVANKKTGRFTDHDAILLSLIASIAAISIERARLSDNVLAERDNVIAAQEQARQALARDLHDGPVQHVTGVVMRLDFCQQLLQRNPEERLLLAKEIEQAKEEAKRATRQMRTTLFELYPLALESEGLAVALQLFLERKQKDVEPTRLIFKLKTNPVNVAFSRQESQVEKALFAIAQEAVNNALKHAQAPKIEIHLKETDEALSLIVSDDGLGFDPAQVGHQYEQRGSLGMRSMRERAELIGGDFMLDSKLGQGTHISVYVPKAKEIRLKKRQTTGRLTLPVTQQT